jgi:hypothetical protein
MSFFRKIITVVALLAFIFPVSAQDTVLTEGFENGGVHPPNWVSSSESGNPGRNWGISNRFQTEGLYCDTAKPYQSDTLYLTSPIFDCSPYSFVSLQFDQICDISGFDSGRVQVRDSGGTWQTISSATYYEGPPAGVGPIWFSKQAYNSFSYPNPWNGLIIPPSSPTIDNTWWKRETFNLSSFLAGSDSCELRFVLENRGSIPTSTENGWFLDNILVTADLCETIKPLGNFDPPFIPNKSKQFSFGPYTITGTFTDKHSGIDTAFIYYKVNGALTFDSIGMVKTATPDQWMGAIPKLYNGVDTFKLDDSVCYYVKAIDKSFPCANFLRLPDPSLPNTDPCNKFYISGGEPLPFCDNFDVLNLWTDSASPAIPLWELGDPTLSGGFPPFSPPLSWITKEVGDYPNNTVSYLYSPIFDFGNAKTPRLTFMQNRQMIVDGDNFSLEYAINGGAWTTLGTANDPAGIALNMPNCPSTWYTATGSSSVGASWNGLSSGWEQSFYQLPISFNSVGSVQFRFKFQSDAGGTDYGVAIDDFCIQNPAPLDLSVVEVIAPGNYLVNEDHFIRTVGDLDSVILVVRNLGTDTLFTVPVEYSVDSAAGSFVNSETFTYPRTYKGTSKPYLLPLELDTFQMTTGYTVPNGLYYVKAYPQLPADADHSNDTIITRGHFGFITSSISYYTDFESVQQYWSTLPFPVGECGGAPDFGGTRWERGTPNWNVTTGTRSGVNAWDINLDSGYTENQVQYLYTQFFDLSNWDQAFVSFWQNRNTDISNDGFRLWYRVAPSTTWLYMESFVGTPDEINWFNSATTIQGGDGWSGNSGGWMYSEFPFTSLPGGGGSLLPKANATKVQFRFEFASDNAGSSIEDGVSIDDFRIVNPPLYDVEVVEFKRPDRGCVMDIEEDVEIQVKNVGKSPIDSIIVCFEFYGPGATTPPSPGPFCDTLAKTIPLPVGNTITHVFTDFADMSPFGVYTFTGYTSHYLDTNLTNDTVTDYTAENVEGCEMGVTFTTGGFIPVGSYLYVIDTTNVPHDTIYEEPFSNIGPNAIQAYREVCMENVGDYKFVITPNAAGFITYWNLQDLYADTSIGLGSAPTGPTGYGFHWQCPPLLSASSKNLDVIGSLTSLPIAQEYTFAGVMKNQGSINIRTFEFSINIDKTFPTAVPSVLTHKDTITITGKGAPTLGEWFHTFNTTWDGEPGEYEICIWTSQPNNNPDLYTSDDTTCLTFVVLDTVNSLATPYCNNFDGLMNPWASLSANAYSVVNSFEKGSPAQPPLNTPGSAPNAWMTGLSTDYVVLDSSSIVSPLFKIDDTSACYQLSFTHQFKTEYAFDGAVVEYSIDSGFNWNVVGSIDDSIYTMSNNNWYNTPYVVGLNGSPNPPGWTGNSNGLIASSYDLKFPDFGVTEYHVVFRLRFGGDGSINDVGWLVDDFCFQKAGVCIYATCDDEIQNQGETDVDCGGPNCAPCENCADGILNQNETDVDCGGVCAPCPSCVDGIMNGNETSIDCGGPDCAACGTCSDGIRNFQWVEEPAGSGIFVQKWEDVFGDCGGPCPDCWVGIDELNGDRFALGQNIPNPTDGRTTINYAIPASGTVVVSVRNLLGQTMYETTLSSEKGIGQLEIDVKDWADGVYYYSIEFDGERLIKKMTVNK